MYPRTSYRRTPPWVTAARSRRRRSERSERIITVVFVVAGLLLACAAYVPAVVAAIS